MIGKRSAPIFKAKAAETAGVLLFAVRCLENHMAKFEAKSPDVHLCARLLLESGKAALGIEEIMREHDRVLPRAAQCKLLSLYLRHISLFERAGGDLKPKHHLMVHLWQQTCRHGNPRFYSTYRDESLNGVIARIAKSTHRWSFMDVTHRHYSILQQTSWTTQMH